MIDPITHRQIVDVSYYDDFSRLSNSAIGWFIKNGPAYFHARMNQEIEEESTSAMDRGTAIHMALLQPEEFSNHYVIWDKNKPKSAQQEKFCQELAQSTEIEPNKALLSAYKASYSTNGKQDDLMLSEASKIASEQKEYINWLKEPNHREMLTMPMYNKIQKIKSNIDKHKLAKSLLNPTEGEWHHEFHINWEYKWNNKSINCKSLLDSVCFDFNKKEVTLMDIKTTTKLHHFEDSVEQYDYFRQLAFYALAIKWYLENERGEEHVEDWKIWTYIIAIDAIDTAEVSVYRITDNQLWKRLSTITTTIADIIWHTEHNLWEHSRDYYEGDGAEELNL